MAIPSMSGTSSCVLEASALVCLAEEALSSRPEEGAACSIHTPPRTLSQHVTHTPTRTLSQHVTHNSTRTLSQHVTHNPTRTLSQHVTHNPTRTLSQHVTHTPTRTLSQHVTHTPTRTLSQHVTHTPTRTLSQHVTHTPTRTLSQHVTHTPTRTLSQHVTHNPTRTLSQHVTTGHAGITTPTTAQAQDGQVFHPSVVENGLFQQLSNRFEHSTRTQGVTPAQDVPQLRTNVWACPQARHEAALCLQSLNLCCCSDIYSSNGRLVCAELGSDSESVYIYAESIQGCDTSCSGTPRDRDALRICAESAKLSREVTRDPAAFWNGTYKAKRRSDSLDSDSVMVCLDAEDKSSFDSPDYSIEAVYGSDYSHDSESVRGNYDSASTCVCTDSRWSSDCADASAESLYSPFEAQQGFSSSSPSSDSSGYTADFVLESPCCTVERHLSSDSAGDYGTGRCDSFGSHFEEASYDLYNASPPSSDAGSRSRKVKGLDRDSDSPGFQDCNDLALSELRGAVTHTARRHFTMFFREMVKEAEQERDQDKVNVSEGFLFHPQKFLQAKNSEYREGREYSLLRHIQNGSYGDVFSIRDKQTGFTCAAKKIPLCSFSWEEVSIWSRLDSPRILQLFGAVREGLNVVLFMDLKAGSLAQLLKARGSLPEDMALFYYCQVLQALEHIHSRLVIHLDVKVDNVLLSMDGRECFLCDFGLSETLDQTGYSIKTLRGQGLRGTESHVSPEVARGDPRSDRADVWSSCCMLLHMLTGYQPWTRYYAHPLCLKIVSEPPPLWEIPPGCDLLTCEVIRGGLVKEPKERDSAGELLVKATRALRSVGGYCNLVLSATQTLPLLRNTERPHWPPSREVQIPALVTITPQEPLRPVPKTSPPAVRDPEQLSAPRIQWVSPWRERAGEEDETGSRAWDSGGVSRCDGDGWRGVMEQHWGVGDLAETFNARPTEGRGTRGPAGQAMRESDDEHGQVVKEREDLRDVTSDEEEEEEEEEEPFLRTQILCGTRHDAEPLIKDEYWETDEESIMSARRSGNMFLPDANSKLTFTCHRSTCDSEPELTDKDSDWSDEWSSGVFSSYSSLADEQSFNVDWSVSTNQPPSCCFEGLGVDIWVEDVSGDTLKIRERPKVKLGHVAVGISAQISMRTFSLATLDGKLVSPDAEVLESGMWLQCVPAPDGCSTWDWRIRDGKMEMQEHDGFQSDTCSTLEA
ncbi:uncharacterized protein map3k14b [Brachyhypopomus gauderio]|uniref:uncharacterized protein map3k14b n=1 Tax=Brachyhypopomus gauderio TaxID=698409 RepID=UPI004041C07A